MLKIYQNILQEFKSLKGNGKLVLFGSIVRGRSRFDSDIDIAAVTDDKEFLTKVERIADRILFKYGNVVSVIKFSEKEFESDREPIIKEIKRGIVIHGGI